MLEDRRRQHDGWQVSDRGRMLSTARSCTHAAAIATPCRGVGVGLRYAHHEHVLTGKPSIDWLEVHAENYLGGIALDDLLAIRRDYPISVHATALSLGSSHCLSIEHLERVAALCERAEPGLVSDHLSWSAVPPQHLPDLLPLPYTTKALDVCSTNIDRVQNRLKRQLLVENPSRYMAWATADFPEGDFLAALVKRTGCGVLLDLNNILVSATNLGRSATDDLIAMMGSLPVSAVREVHVAGHSIEELPAGVRLCVDDHGSAVSDDVWALVKTATEWLDDCPLLVEWDTNIPSFDILEAQAERARGIVTRDAEGPHALK